MKQIYFTVAMFFVAAISFAQTSELLISKYGEGTSNNKFFEIYNGTGAPVNLDGYAWPSVSNDPTVVGEYEFWNTFNPGAVIADGDVYVVAHGSADATILAQADQTFNFLSNGDDGFALVLNNGTFNDLDMDGEVDAGEMTGFTILDFLGDFNGDPGTGWDVAGVVNGTANNTLTRKSSVCGPNNDWDASRGYDATTMMTTAAASEWIVTGSNSGWNTLGSFVGCSTAAVLNITSPADGTVLAGGTTSVDITFSAQNAPATATYDINVDGTLTTGVTSPFTMTVQDGGSYMVTVNLVDGATTIATDVTNFSVAFPCDLQIGTITETCQTNTAGVDLYDVTIDYTGGGTSTYTIDTAGNGVVAGDNPSTVAAGQIMITGVTEGTNFTITFSGDPTNSSCSFTRSITSPACIGNVVCANPGDIIITEIMQNPAAVGDNVGEYFEVYNTTSAPINMQGWEIKDDLTASETHVISGLIVPANGYAVLGLSSDSTINGGIAVDYEYNGVSLGNVTDGIMIDCTGTVIDIVIYDDGVTFPDGTGASMELAVSKYNSTDNDLGVNWGLATSTYGAGDLGTPGAVNDFTLSNEQFTKNSFKLFPNPVSGNEITISVENGNPVDVIIYSALGQQVISQKAVTNSINVSSLNAGLYIVKVSQNGNSQTRKLVVQ
ncbi:hypothetical protein BST92_04220 [Nonlabens arenilitoris]|uniref:LTD domain-containing protein n=1 Tax=Nonlabens arenilitoris TaxID=1217969 RepID=A0A2S7U882_9FLAO|nr:lamin tail domain-containing protein [Nonlabens arenilitoris]PQJ31176.1 hypothetical protein BST92_04220 [Nonlabens arenilitoris]